MPTYSFFCNYPTFIYSLNPNELIPKHSLFKYFPNSCWEDIKTSTVRNNFKQYIANYSLIAYLPLIYLKYPTISSISSFSNANCGILTRSRKEAGLEMKALSSSSFQYSVTLRGRLSSGPSVPPRPLTEWQVWQCSLKRAYPLAAVESGSNASRRSAFFTRRIRTRLYGHL